VKESYKTVVMIMGQTTSEAAKLTKLLL